MVIPAKSQVLVVGGGPSGSTAATLLAREGADVVLLEREHFPRYHIGESLLPSILGVLDLLGAREKIESHGFVRKYGGYFAWGADSWELNFERLVHPYGFQVSRAEFDQLLLDHARSQGVTVCEGTEVREIIFEQGRPRQATWAAADGTSGITSFDYLIDASGRAGLMATRYNKNCHLHHAFQNVAIWGYWNGAGEITYAPPGGLLTAAIPDGWLWAIPLRDGTMSVGLVVHRDSFKELKARFGSLQGLYRAAIADCPLVQDLLAAAEQVSPLRADQDYSYMAQTLSGPGYIQVGDAASFIDPLLSTGVHLATHAAVLGAASLASVLRGEVTEDEALAFFERSYRRAYLRLLVVVSGLYQLYDGKLTHFWKAQELTQHDYDDSEALNEAFLYIVSGMEDVKDSARALRELQLDGITAQVSEEEAERILFMDQAYNRVFLSTNMHAESDGFYVTTQPRLGIATAGEAVTAAAR